MPRPRPLSPHLQVYRLPLAALTSITHRLTGIALMVGSIVLVAWLWAAATSTAYFTWWQSSLKAPVGLFCLAGWSFALCYHLCTGIRHLIWDAGFGFKKETSRFSSVLVVLIALALTGAMWFLAYPKIMV